MNNGATVRGENRRGYGGRGVFIYGEKLEPELEKLDAFLPEGGVFVDVGASVGVFSMKAAKQVGERGLVISLEPFPRIASQLLDNTLENGFSNVRIRLCCASDKVGTALFWMNRNTPNSFGLFPEVGATAFNTLTVTLDWLVEVEGLERVDYLKIDAERAEELILKGGRRMIERFRPIIQVEVDKNFPAQELPDYRVWNAGGGANRVFIPAESTANELAVGYGWTEESGGRWCVGTARDMSNS